MHKGERCAEETQKLSSSAASGVHWHVVPTDRTKSNDTQKRLINFGARVARVSRSLPTNQEGRYISQQLLRSGLSAAPNYAEARAAESRADFIHKLRVVLKELNETMSWLEQIPAIGLISRDKLSALIAENQELCYIIAASIRTARHPQGSPGPI